MPTSTAVDEDAAILVARGAAACRSRQATIVSESSPGSGAEQEAAVIRRVRAACARALQEAIVRSHNKQMVTPDGRVELLLRIAGRLVPGLSLWRGSVTASECYHRWLNLTHCSDADTHLFAD
eukprot:TRINITY_DN77553_c0_g1_i1.p1 TRINITY_DN77553_c0_g1~~TRINITY_DN77553_c0_g1_i1.p1  ORF type:complete len:142 (+),score=13.73 TRINITY_DN77553_c0_g1_i1:60-428(+)